MCSAVIVKNLFALNALVSSKQIRFKQTSETLKSGREFQTVGPAAVSVEMVVRYCKYLTVGGTQMLTTGTQLSNRYRSCQDWCDHGISNPAQYVSAKTAVK